MLSPSEHAPRKGTCACVWGIVCALCAQAVWRSVNTWLPSAFGAAPCPRWAPVQAPLRKRETSSGFASVLLSSGAVASSRPRSPLYPAGPVRWRSEAGRRLFAMPACNRSVHVSIIPLNCFRKYYCSNLPHSSYCTITKCPSGISMWFSFHIPYVYSVVVLAVQFRGF